MGGSHRDKPYGHNQMISHMISLKIDLFIEEWMEACLNTNNKQLSKFPYLWKTKLDPTTGDESNEASREDMKWSIAMNEIGIS